MAAMRTTDIVGQTLAIQPMVNENGDVVWVCGESDDPLNVYAGTGRQRRHGYSVT